MMQIGLLDSNHFEITKISKALLLLLFPFLSALLLFAAGFYYEDLGCDGGWYSYPALALSRGGNPGENLDKIDSIKSVEGVKAIFGFKTYTSVRIFYTTLWFKYISKNIFFLKLLSLLELITLFTLGYFLISKFCQDKVIALMLLAVFINDKTTLLNAAYNYRPDNMVAALSCLTFLSMHKQNGAFPVIFAIVAGCLMMLTHTTAVIPFTCIISFFVFQNILSGKYDVKENYKYMLIALFAVFVFIHHDAIFDSLLLSNGQAIPQPVNAVDRILNTWEKGPGFILRSKELYRWKTYFFTSNIAQLLVLILGVTLFFKQPYSSLLRDKIGLSLILSVITGFILFAVFDPHRENTHAIPLVPFFFLLLSHTAHSGRIHRKAMTYILVGLICVSSFSSIALAGKIFVEGERLGYNIVAMRNTFEKLLQDKDHEYLIVGPTQIWPFIEEDKNVLIVDSTRSGKDFQVLEPIIDSVDYVIINKDYRGYKWKESFLQYFPSLYLKKIHHIGSQNQFIKIYTLEKNVGKEKNVLLKGRILERS